MNWLHCSHPPIIHRDLKPSNVMLTEDLTAKVGDMGLSAIKVDKKIQGDGAGSYLWMAPEALLYEPHNEKADVYSFAIVMWQMFAWEPDPYKKYLEMGDLDLLIQAVCHSKERPKIPEDVHPEIKSLIEQGWHDDPRKRPSMAEILTVIDDLIITTCFENEEVAKFWKKNWGGKVDKKTLKTLQTTVAFDEFATQLYIRTATRLPQNKTVDTRWLCLKALCTDAANPESVDIERFSLVCQWFGSLTRNSGIIEEIHDIVKNEWFHGDISKEEAVELLNASHQRRFLVRLNLTSPPISLNPFTFSKLNKNKTVHHQRISYDNLKGIYSITVTDTRGSHVYSSHSLVRLITKLKTKKIIKELDAPRKKYNKIFQQQTTVVATDQYKDSINVDD